MDPPWAWIWNCYPADLVSGSPTPLWRARFVDNINLFPMEQQADFRCSLSLISRQTFLGCEHFLMLKKKKVSLFLFIYIYISLIQTIDLTTSVIFKLHYTILQKTHFSKSTQTSRIISVVKDPNPLSGSYPPIDRRFSSDQGIKGTGGRGTWISTLPHPLTLQPTRAAGSPAWWGRGGLGLAS